MRMLIAALIVVGCASSRPAAPIVHVTAPARARPAPPPVTVNPNALSTYEAHARVRRHLRDIGMRSEPKCVCESLPGGGTQCSW